MEERKIRKNLLALIMVVTILGSLVDSVNVFAAETDTTTSSDSNDFDVRYQEPVQITEFEQAGEKIASRRTGNIEINPEAVECLPMIMSETTVLCGSVTDYLLQTDDFLVYPITLPAGVYLQAQLIQPADNSIDYDLYLLDAEGNILVGSDYYTYLNGTNGTLPEAIGYITSGNTTTYYMAVLSSLGGSVNEAYTLTYSISDTCDYFEIDETAKEALPFTLEIGGAYVDSRNLNSPVDNDWYAVTIPSNSIYGQLKLSVETGSTNECAVEVYQNISSVGYEMKRIDDNNIVNVSEGVYYIRVTNQNTAETFDGSDIQNYTLHIVPVLAPTDIEVLHYNGNEGLDRMVQYPGYPKRYFRTTGWITVSGRALAYDPDTQLYYVVIDCPITAYYYNPYWDANHTSSYVERYGYGVTDSTGNFSITLQLPPAMGALTYRAGVSTQYYDFCTFNTYATDYPNVIWQDNIFHYDRSDYTG